MAGILHWHHSQRPKGSNDAFVRLLRHRRALCRRWRNHYNDSADHKGVKLHPFKSVDKSSQLACRLREGQGNETQMVTEKQCSMVFPKIEELL